MTSARSHPKLCEIGSRKTVKVSLSPRPMIDNAKHSASTPSAVFIGFNGGVIGRAGSVSRGPYGYEPQFRGQEQVQFSNAPMQSRGCLAKTGMSAAFRHQR